MLPLPHLVCDPGLFNIISLDELASELAQDCLVPQAPLSYFFGLLFFPPHLALYRPSPLPPASERARPQFHSFMHSFGGLPRRNRARFQLFMRYSIPAATQHSHYFPQFDRSRSVERTDSTRLQAEEDMAPPLHPARVGRRGLARSPGALSFYRPRSVTRPCMSQPQAQKKPPAPSPVPRCLHDA